MDTLPQTPPSAQRCAKCRLADALRMQDDAQKRVLEIDPYANPREYDRALEAARLLAVKTADLRLFAASRQATCHLCEEHA